MIDWEGIAIFALIAVVFGIGIWEYIEWRIDTLIGWFMHMMRMSSRLALDSAHATLDELKTLDERVTTLVEEIVQTRVDEAMQRFYNGEVLPDPGSKSTTNDLSA
ncbi:MAG: hypothetical protein IT298_13425 [Chloroflexi bacterium]|nr:hypothetical protein [Chloroflexota bacterium]